MTKSSSVNKDGRIASRDSNIELLRIICMAMIVAHHLFLHGGIFEQSGSNMTNLLWGEYCCPAVKSDMTALLS